MPELRDPLLKVVTIKFFLDADFNYKGFKCVQLAGEPAKET